MWLPQARWMVNFMENPPRKNGWELGVPHDLGKLHMGFNGSSYGMIGQNAIKYLAVHFKTVASYGCSSPFFLVKSTFFYGFSTISNHQLHQNPPCFPKKTFGISWNPPFFSVKYGSVTMFHPFPMVFLSFFHPTTHRARARAPRCRSSSPARTPRWTATGRARFRWPNRPGNGNMVGTWWDHNLVGLQHG